MLNAAGLIERDYTGVPTAELALVYERNADCDLRTFASRIEMDERDLKKVVVSQNYPFTGLAVADKILIGLGISLHDLVDAGELHIIPARGSENAARRMIEDEMVLRATSEIGTLESARMTLKEALDQGLMPEPTEEEMRARVLKILSLRGELATNSPEQAERLRRDSERSSERLARKRKEGREAA